MLILDVVVCQFTPKLYPIHTMPSIAKQMPAEGARLSAGGGGLILILRRTGTKKDSILFELT